MSDEILFEQIDNVGIITINKPKANQLSHEVLEGIRKQLDVNELVKDVRALVITGSGEKIFSAGADLSSGFGDFNAIDFLQRGQDVWNKIAEYPKPIIAAVNGHAYGGGCELAMACHFRFMKEGGKIGLTETNLGIIPGYGGTLRLPQLVGEAKALKMILLAERLEAKEALEIGLVDKVCSPENLMDEATDFAKILAKRPPLSVKAILKIFASTKGLSQAQHLKIEREELAKLFGSKDMMEGMTAFAQKREPNFKGE